MSYSELVNIVGLYENKDLFHTLSKYYQNKNISGLHYFEHVPSIDKKFVNTTAIITPSQTVHHEATCFLIDLKNGEVKLNTVLSIGNAIKRFLDFLLIWELDLREAEVDLKAVILGFIYHLRVIDKYRPRKVIEWSFLTKVPLNEAARSSAKVLRIGADAKGLMEKKSTSAYEASEIKKMVASVLDYLEFLKKKDGYVFGIKTVRYTSWL